MKKKDLIRGDSSDSDPIISNLSIVDVPMVQKIYLRQFDVGVPTLIQISHLGGQQFLREIGCLRSTHPKIIAPIHPDPPKKQDVLDGYPRYSSFPVKIHNNAVL